MKNVNFKRVNRDRKKLLKQDEDIGNEFNYCRSSFFQVKIISIKKYSSKNIFVIYPKTKIFICNLTNVEIM